MKTISIALAATALTLIAGQAAAQAPGPNCKPAQTVTPPAVPVGGSPQSARDASRPAHVTAISGVVADGVVWTKVWQQGGNSADGAVPDRDGGLLVAQEDYDSVVKLAPDDKASVFLSGSGGLSSLSFDREGRLYGAHRTERIGSTKPNKDSIVNAISQLAPERLVVADKWTDGTPLTVRPNDLAADASGGVYFTSGCLYYATSAGASVVADDIRSNGLVLSEDEHRLFVTNGSTIVVFDVTAPGRLANRRDFARLPETDSADGIALDSEGRLYAATVAAAVPGVHVFAPDGSHLGLIPTPRPVISVAFAGPQRKTLYVVGSGADDAEGRLIREGPQQTAATIYRLPAIASGLASRAK